MKASKIVSAVFLAAGAALAGCTLWLSLHSLQAEPVLVRQSSETTACAQALLEDFCAGDYSAASRRLYGMPRLGSGLDGDSQVGQLIWQSFVDSLEYTLEGEPYAVKSGIAQDVTVQCMEITSVTRNLKERSRLLLARRINDAQDVSEIYDESNNYREEFVMDVLRNAAEDAIREDAQMQTYHLTLTMVYEYGQWWVMPDSALIQAVSGGIAG